MLKKKFIDQVATIVSDNSGGTQVEITHITDPTYEMEVEDLFTHYVLHTSYHRSKIMTLLKKMGYKTATLDYILFPNDTVIYSDNNEITDN